MRLEISQLYDSHVHWLGTGLIENGLKLFDLRSAESANELRTLPAHFRGNFLVGFGWDQSKWSENKMPTKKILDHAFPNFPVFFQRADGHTSWLNSRALEYFGLSADHSGILREEEHFAAYARLPKYADAQIGEALKTATRLFNEAGFTHIRDMTCDEQQWRQAKRMDEAGELTLYVQESFLVESAKDLEHVLELALRARDEQTPHLQVQGLKLFYDGTLGSDTAYLSRCPCTPQNFSWTIEEIEFFIRKCWENKLEVAIHTIGDEAAHQVVQIARAIMAKNELTGWLNLEHVEVLRPETIKMMKALHVRCHMQPCHWLSDREWLRQKLADLYPHAFPWGSLSRSGVPLHFGSDSPVARISFWDNERALRESVREDIAAPKGQILDYHTFPKPAARLCRTSFEDQKLVELIFDGEVLIKAT